MSDKTTHRQLRRCMCRCGHSLVSIYQGTKSSHCMHTEHLLVLKSVQNSNNSSTTQLISSHDQQPLRHMLISLSHCCLRAG
jgi:hypothetical protein